MNLSKRELITATITTLAIPLATDMAKAIDMSPSTDNPRTQASMIDAMCDSHSLEIFYAGDGEGYKFIYGYEGEPLAPGYYYAVTEDGCYVTAPVGPFSQLEPVALAMLTAIKQG